MFFVAGLKCFFKCSCLSLCMYLINFFPLFFLVHSLHFLTTIQKVKRWGKMKNYCNTVCISNQKPAKRRKKKHGKRKCLLLLMVMLLLLVEAFQELELCSNSSNICCSEYLKRFRVKFSLKLFFQQPLLLLYVGSREYSKVIRCRILLQSLELFYSLIFVFVVFLLYRKWVIFLFLPLKSMSFIRYEKCGFFNI